MANKRPDTSAIEAELSHAQPNAYQAMIMHATGCSTADAAIVEDIMRNEIFHSTLDWQTQSELQSGARQAHRLFTANRADYESCHRAAREAYLQMRWGANATHKGR
jgi:hypothetical protein